MSAATEELLQLFPVYPAGDWTQSALCAQVDPELWFPEKGGSPAEARATCFQCPVQAECLEEGVMSTPVPAGIWGGYGEKARWGMRRERGAA